MTVLRSTALGYLLVGGCVVDTPLGDDEGDANTTEAVPGDDDGPSSDGPGASSGRPTSGGATGTGAVDTGANSGDADADAGTDGTTDDGFVDECDWWEPPKDGACEPRRGRNGRGGRRPLARDDRRAVHGRGHRHTLPPAVSVELSCTSGDYVLQIEATGFTLPVTTDDEVLLSTGLGFMPPEGQESFAIRDPDLGLLVAWVNDDREHDDLFAEVLDPFTMDISGSGCAGEPDRFCGGVRQRAQLTFENGGPSVALFDGQSGLVTGRAPYTVVRGRSAAVPVLGHLRWRLEPGALHHPRVAHPRRGSAHPVRDEHRRAQRQERGPSTSRGSRTRTGVSRGEIGRRDRRARAPMTKNTISQAM